MSESAPSDVVERLVQRLTEVGADFKLTTHAEVRTSAEAAAVRGTSLHSGAKALIVKTEADFALLVMPADLALKSASARKILKSNRMRFATPEELLELTGLLPGSVPPFGSLFGLQTICDTGLGDNERINFNCGSRTQSIQMRYVDYIAVESPTLGCITRSAGD